MIDSYGAQPGLGPHRRRLPTVPSQLNIWVRFFNGSTNLTQIARLSVWLCFVKHAIGFVFHAATTNPAKSPRSIWVCFAEPASHLQQPSQSGSFFPDASPCPFNQIGFVPRNYPCAIRSTRRTVSTISSSVVRGLIGHARSIVSPPSRVDVTNAYPSARILCTKSK